MPERRIVTKGSGDGTFVQGDHIILYENGDIGCLEARGWIPAEEVADATIRMEHSEDVEYARRRKQKLLDGNRQRSGVLFIPRASRTIAPVIHA